MLCRLRSQARGGAVAWPSLEFNVVAPERGMRRLRLCEARRFTGGNESLESKSTPG
jgi:hypothetical protein